MVFVVSSRELSTALTPGEWLANYGVNTDSIITFGKKTVNLIIYM